MGHLRYVTRPQQAAFEYDEDTVRLQAMNALLSTLTQFYINLVRAKGKGDGTATS